MESTSVAPVCFEEAAACIVEDYAQQKPPFPTSAYLHVWKNESG